LVGAFLISILRSTLPKKSWYLIIFSIALFIVSVYCVLAPGRSYPHYILLLFVPIGVILAVVVHGVVIGLTSRLPVESSWLVLARPFTIAVILLVTVCYHFHTQFSYRPDFLDKAEANYKSYVPFTEVTSALKKFTAPDIKMAIWGWGTELWVTTNFRLGTRYTNTAGVIEQGSVQDFYTKRFLIDLEKNKPLLFVDTVAPGFFRYSDRSLYGFENFLSVKKYIDRNYTFHSEMKGVRIFKRNMLPAQAGEQFQ
jgi:hypothetical protein